jgi:hypothetical protein
LVRSPREKLWLEGSGASITVERVQNLDDLDPFTLSRRLSGVADRYRAFSHSLSEHEAIHHPFGRDLFPGLSHFRWAQALPESDPMRVPLLRWIYFLADARINVSARSYEADLEYREKHPVTQPVSGKLSLSELRREALLAKRGSAADFWRARAQFEGKLSAHRLAFTARKQEIAERMGGTVLHQFWSPFEESGDVRALAQRVLTETDEAAEHFLGRGWSEFVEGGLARAAAAGWPARLAPDVLYELFHEKELYQSVTIDLGALPERICPASYLRAAARLGYELSRALVAQDLPFVLSFDPHGGSHEELGALFLLWVVSPAFHSKKLKLSRQEAGEMTRALAPAVLAHVRLTAARALVEGALQESETRIVDECRRVMFALCREELPDSAALARFRVPDNAATRLAALLSAFSWEAELVQEYDEDWYLNPRAGQDLRERGRRLVSRHFSIERCERGLETYKSRLA